MTMTFKIKTRRVRRERGLALVELLLFTIPLCIMSIVFASAIAATSSAKEKSMWKASLQAQLATTQPCGGLPMVEMPSMSDKQGQFTQGKSKASIIADVALPMTLTGSQTKSVTEPTAKFYFESLADKMLPGRSRQSENAATFPCNEPDHGDDRRDADKLILTGIATEKARELF